MMSEDTSTPRSTCPCKKIKALLRHVTKRQVEQLELFAEIEKEVTCLTDSNEKLKLTANQNAELVKQAQMRCKDYKQENQALKLQLSLITSARLHEIHVQSPGSDHTSSKSRGREDVSSDEQPDRTERKGSKLSTNKQNKKVRYKELPSEEKRSPVLSPQLPGQGGGRETQELQSPPAPVEKVIRSKFQKVMGPLSRRENRDVPPDLEMGSVFVPETIPLEVISDDDDTEEEEGDYTEDVRNDTSRTDLSRLARKKSKRNKQRKPNDYLVIVPETVPMDSIPYAHHQDSIPEDLLIGDDREYTKFLEHLLPLEQSTPMLPAPSSDSLRRKTLSSMNSASPVYADGKRSQKGSIPPTESQLSVDFSTTQMSPTFNRSRSTPNRQEGAIQSSSSKQQSGSTQMSPTINRSRSTHNRQESAIQFSCLKPKSGSHSGKAIITLENPLGNVLSTPENIHSSAKMISSTSKASNPVWDTPEDTNLSRRDPAVTSDNDKSGQSEASFLILQLPPSSRGPSQVRSSAEPSKKEVVVPDSRRKSTANSEGEQHKKRRLSDGLTDETASKKTRTIKQVDFDSSQRNENGLCNKDERRRVDDIKTESSGQTSGRSDQSSKNSSKLMKQTRLTKDSFKAVVSEEGRRHKDLNGGSRVYVNSQDDPYMQQAIQESMAVQKGVNQDVKTGNGDFKVPRLPKVPDHKQTSKVSSSSGATSRRPHPRGNDNRPMNEDEEISLLEERSNLDYNNEGDMNGSLDPAVRFSFIGDDEDADDDGEDQKSIESRRTKHGSLDASIGTRKPLLVMPGDSQADQRRGLHPDSRHTAPKESRINYEDLEGDEVENKRLLLVEDSLDDMFEDDDDDDDGEDDDGGGSDEDRQDQGMEIEEGYGLGDGNIPETSVQGRIKFGDASHRDPDFDLDLERRLGETDEMHSSFVREFDRPPQRDDVPAYKYTDVVRKRDERQKLKGFDCKSCTGYYGELGLTSEEIAMRTKKCSKHRYHYSPPSTPPHYWSVDFPDTQACVERGYLKEAKDEEMPKKKRKNRYLSNFGKNKLSGEEET